MKEAANFNDVFTSYQTAAAGKIVMINTGRELNLHYANTSSFRHLLIPGSVQYSLNYDL